MRIKKIPKLAIWLVMFFSLFQVALAQNRTITGKVIDQNGNGVSGATVTIKGTGVATQTDAAGNYSINAPANGTLVFSSVGFAPSETGINNRATVDVSLQTQNASLSEVVVVGYGTARRRDITGSVASVRAKDFNKGVITAPDQLIQGKVAGVQIINNSGQPGGATTVRIRGNASIRSGNQPLFVVDGVPLSGGSARPGFNGSGGALGANDPGNPLSFINPNDIASMEVLKDASATAIYGSRGANGVIIITTKRGLTGAPSLDINASTGVSNIMKRLDVLNGDEYRAALKQYSLSGGDFGSNVNALDAILRSALTQNYNFAINGGNENGRYRISGGYLDQEGIIKTSDLKKYTGNVSTSFKFLNSRKLGVDFNLLASHNTESLAPISTAAGFEGNIIAQALQWNPTHPLTKNGAPWIDPAVGSTTINPLVALNAYNDIVNTNTILASISPSYKFTKSLEYRFLYSINHSEGIRRTQIDSSLNLQGIQGRGSAAYSNNAITTQQFTNTLSYNNELSAAVNLNAVIGHEYLKFDNRGIGLSALDFAGFGLNYTDYLQYSSQNSRNIYSFAPAIDELQSFFARAIVNINDKYVLTGTIRADGSSKFGENNKYGYFPSFAGAWNINNEDFLKGSTAISNLKLRLGWGKTGNQEFGSGASLSRYTIGRQSITQANVGNPNLKWETSKTTNIGVDFGLFRDRLSGSLDYFNKKTTGVLFEQLLAQPGPLNTKQWINLPGYITNKGLEVALNMGLVRNNDINWNLGVNATFLDNVVQGINGFYETGQLFGQGISAATSQRIISGYPLNTFYLPIFTGIDKTSGQSTYQGGDPSANKFYLGNPNPKTLLGINTDVSFKKLTFSASFNGAFGHYLYNNTANSVLPIGNLGTRNLAKNIVGQSIQENLSNPIAPSSRYLEKGDYLKMTNASLNYSLGTVGKIFRNANITLTGQNLFVITNYTGFDPEVNTVNQLGGIPSLGIEYIPFPTARTITLGVNFSL